MALSQPTGTDIPEGVFSLLDTDLYKLTMQYAVLMFFPDVDVSYKFTNRTPQMTLTRTAYHWLQQQVDMLKNVVVTEGEIQWLRKTCPYLKAEYLAYLEHFRFRPDDHVKLVFNASTQMAGDDDAGELDIEIKGLWVETILYEIPLLALVSQAYFKFVDRDWNHANQEQSAKQKGLRLLSNGCLFSEFGSRRRRDYKTHAMVVAGLVEAQREADTNGQGWTGKFSGTSNVHMAQRFGVNPIGTVAHEWFMAIAALTDDYPSANETAMQYWVGTFGRGVLAIALTDTFGTPAFLRAFARPAPKSGKIATEAEGEDPSYADIFTGVRQDSGDPLAFIPLMRKFYTDQGIKDKKVIVFSDSLNAEKCIRYKDATEAAGLTPSFGIGTFFTNDFRRLSDGQKSVPLNIVIKIAEANGQKAIKLSDDVGKNMGDDKFVDSIKKQVGYEDKSWQGSDEAHRWDE